MASLRDAALQLFTALDRLGIRYAVGGSFASSFHGIARATLDINVVLELPQVLAKAIYLAVSPDFYADDAAMVEAIGRGRAFNLIHLESGHKFDLFVAGRHPLGEEQLMHRKFAKTTILGGEPLDIPVVSAEDIVLVKLLWCRAGGEVSERQWNDLTNLAAVQKGRADAEYMKTQAARVGVSDLLSRLWGE